MRVPFFLLCFLAGAARAEEPPPEARASLQPDVVPAPPRRPFLFTEDPSLPAPGEVLVTTTLSSVSQSGQARPVGPGSMFSTPGVELGVLPQLAIFANGGDAFQGSGAGSSAPLPFEAGARFLLTRPNREGWRVGLQAAAGRDLASTTRARVTADAAWESERWQFGTSVSAAHDFIASANALDVTATAAASVKLPENFRAGVQVVGEDLEEMGGDGDKNEGGPTFFAGPTFGWAANRHVEFTAGPALGFARGVQFVLARANAILHF